MVLCAKVARENAEQERRKLSAAGLLDVGLVPARDGKSVYFPLVKGAKTTLLVVQKKLEKRSERPKGLRDALLGKLSAREMDALVSSFDLVGDIAVVEVPPELRAKEKLIASALMSAHHNVKVVAKKVAGTGGEFRIRPVEVIAGEKRTHTIYREGGCEFGLDLNKAYFSPRLGTERGRLCALARPGEKVLVPFAGVGPFAIRMAKAVPGAKVVGVELNPDACAFFRENVGRNHCGNVRVVEGDVAKLLPGKYRGWADRVAMPLPKGAKGFLANAIPCLKKGGMLHYYSFGSVQEPFAEAKEDVAKAACALGRKSRAVFARVVRPYSRDIVQVALDARVF